MLAVEAEDGGLVLGAGGEAGRLVLADDLPGLGSVSSASSSSQSLTQRIMLAGLPHRVRLSSSGRRSSTYCMASMPPQELPNRCSRSRPSAPRTLGHLLDEAIDGPQGEVVGTFGPAAAQLVVEDDLAAVGERLERLQVVVGEAGAAVQAQQRRAIVALLPDGAVPDPAAGNLDEAFVGRHLASPVATGSSGAGSTSSANTRFISGSRSGCLAYR